jgi:hypothetical protein
VLASVIRLDANSNDPHSVQLACEQSRLSIDDGGLGIGLSNITPYAAYLASVLSAAVVISSLERSFIRDYHMDIQNHSSLMFNFKACVSIVNYNNYNTTSILELSGLNIISGEITQNVTSDKLQRKFMESHLLADKNRFLARLSVGDNSRTMTARYISTCGKESGAVILATPKTAAMTFLPEEYRIMIRRRLGLSLSQIHIGLRCNCARHPIIDSLGIHCVTICNKGQGRLIMHDRMKQELASLCRYAQLNVRQEPTDVYRVVDENNGMRPDLEVLGFERGIYGDVSITEPVSSSLTNNNCVVPLRAARIREAQKIVTYSNLTIQTGYSFFPLVCETYGAWGVQLIQFFDMVIKHASESRGIRRDVLAVYWRRRLAVCLHKAIAANILNKVGRSKAGPFRDESNYQLVPAEQLYARHD